MESLYRHYKHRYYQVVDLALDTQTDTSVVVYRTLYLSEYALYTRPAPEFFGMVTLPNGELVRRFTPVSFDQLPAEAKALVVPFIAPVGFGEGAALK